MFDSDSEDDYDDPDSDTEDTSYAGLLEELNEVLHEEQEEQLFERPTFEIDEYVLVGFPKKVGKPEHYVGQILGKDPEGFELQIKFYKRIGVTSKFTQESQQIFDVMIEDIVVKLPKPTILTGSSRTQGQLSFPVDFTNYNVK